MKRQVSDFQLAALRIGVGIIVTILIYALSVAWTCGHFLVFSIFKLQIQSEFRFFSVFYLVMATLNTGVFYNLLEFLLWRLGLRPDFVPKYPPSELNFEWIEITKERWMRGMPIRLLIRNPMWFFFVFYGFSYQADRFCVIS